MITLNIMKNPFKTDREIKQTSYIPGRSLLVYITPEAMGWKEYLVTHNGKVIAPEKYNEIVPASEDYIAICPVIEGDDVGKDIARAVALIAVSIASMGFGNLVAYGTWAGTTAGWGWGSYVAAAATFHAGGALVNHLFPPPKQDVISNIATWSNLPPIAEEGGGIPITFGTVKMGVMAPIQVLNQKITNSGTKSHLNMLLCGGEEVDEIRDITINKQPVSNFPGVKTEVRLGTNDQTPIPGFADTWEEVPVGVELTEEGGWYYAQTKSDIGSGLELTFNFPMGLYYRNDKGKMMYEWIRLQPEYRKVGETDWKYWPSNITSNTCSAKYDSARTFTVAGDRADVFRKYTKVFLVDDEGGRTEANVSINGWYNSSTTIKKTTVTVDTVVPSTLSLVEVRYIDIERKTNSPFSFTTRADDIGTGLVEVRCRIIKEGTDDKRANMTVWSTLTHIIYDDFSRPGKSLVGIQALATDRLSGSLNVTWIQSRFNVWIWNPITERYEQRPANNPAWAAYDVIYRIKQVKNIHTKEEEDEIIIFSDVEGEYMDYQSFADWAAACDERGLKFNGVIHEVNDLWEALAPIEMAGRGKIIIRGTRYSVIHDSPASPTGMYAVSNIVKDSFRIEYVGKKDRANALEITFFNSDNDFEENTVLCYGPDYDGSTMIAKPTQLRLPYAMSLKQAYREGQYQLRLNCYLNRAIYWGAGIDSITGHAGEVVYVQHDVPEWGIGGRIAYVEANDVFLNREVTMEPGQTYGLLVRLADDTLIEKALEPVEETTTTNIVTVTEPFELGKAPVTDDVFSFGLYKREAMPVRLVTVKRSGKLSAELMGLEYIKEIYEEAEEIPEIDYTLPIPKITNILTSERADDLGNIWLDVVWTPPHTVAYYGVRILIDGEPVARLGVYQTAYSHLADEDKTYQINIIGLDVFGNDMTSATVEHRLIGLSPPADVTNLISYFQNSQTWLNWDLVSDYRPVQYEIRKGSNWNSAQLLGRTQETRFMTVGQGTYWVAASWGNLYSVNKAGIVIDEDALVQNVLVQHDEHPDWTGTPSAGAVVDEYAEVPSVYLIDDGLWDDTKEFDSVLSIDFLGSIVPQGTYTISEERIVDLGYAQPCQLFANFEAYMDKPGDKFSTVSLVSALESWCGNYGEYGKVEIQVAIAQNDGVLGDWKTFIPGTYIGRKFNFRLVLSSFDPEITVIVRKFDYTIDMPDRLEKFTSELIPTTGAHIEYTKPFHVVPNVQITITGAQAGDDAELTNETESGFDIVVENNGTLVERRVNILAQGY